LSISENLKSVKHRINEAAVRAGRDPDEITLVTVTKSFPVSRVVEAIEAGARILGENRAKEAAEKFDILGREVEGHSLSWHFIGPLQTNKVKYIIGFADLIHSVDRTGLAIEIDKRAKALGKTQEVLIEVNVSGEDARSGARPEETPRLIKAVSALPNIEVRGLMAMAPMVGVASEARPYFKILRELFERESAPEKPRFDILSMGMTDDYEVAIEEGATLIRVGRAIMGPRPLAGE
jgi:hypothetical protein